MKTDPKIKEFINDLILVDEEKTKTIIKIRKLILKLYPNALEEIKYGGLVYLIENRLFTGIFLRKNHISIEFDNGYEMSDSDNLLEGSGKLRRHLKIRESKEIKTKKVEFYLKQSYKN